MTESQIRVAMISSSNQPNVQLRLPSALRPHTGGVTQLDVQATSVEQALHALEQRLPSLVPLLRDQTGALRPRVNIYVNDEHVRYRQGLKTPLQEGDTVYVTPIIAGG
jgi:molybdopterin converting factor small subunit